MSAVSPIEGIRAIPLEHLRLSDTGAQTERRRHFDKAAIAELAESIKTVGLLSPIIARPETRIDVVESDDGGRWYPAHKRKSIDGHNLIGGGHKSREAAEAEAAELRAKQKYSIVAGERRFIAAKQAGMTSIDVSVRELTDEQVLEVQLVENLQREGLHELAEAEGYEALQALGHPAEEIADKVGKSKAYVYARMKLLALCQDARKGFYEGKLTASTALLLARIPVESIQKQALKEITKAKWDGAGMSYREAFDHVQRNYMLRLGDAGFPTQDATLAPAAGACGPCPKRTGNQRELFGDVKGADVCTDPVCFRAKREAHAARAITQARESGRMVFTGHDAKKIAPHGTRSLKEGYVTLDERCYEDEKSRTYRQLLGKSFEPTLLQDPETGEVVEIAPREALKDALKAAGVKTRPSSGSGTQNAAEKKAKAERAFRQALFAKVRESYPPALTRTDWNDLALAFVHEMQQDTCKQLFALWGWEPTKGKYGNGNYRKAAATYISALSGAEISKFFLDCIIVSDLQVSTWSNEPPKNLLAAAKRVKVNVEQLRRQQNAAAIPKAKKKAKAKGK